VTDKTKLGLRVLGFALVLGVMGDLLLRQVPWGLNALLWTAALGAFIVALGRDRPEMLGSGGYWLLMPILLFGAAFLGRDSTVLALLNVFCIGVALSLWLWRAQGGAVFKSSLVRYGLAAALTSIATTVGAFVALLDVDWKELPGGKTGRTLAVVRGLVLAVPLSVIFGSLFMAADDIFSALVKHVIHVSLTSIVLHLTTTIFAFWITAGYLHGLILWRDQGILNEPAIMLAKLSPDRIPAERHAWLGVTETIVILGSLDAVFLAFVVVQIRYLFGGASLVSVSPGLTYAEYARHGFFALIAVAALSLPVLLAAHWLLHPKIQRAKRVFEALAGIQIVLLFVVMASAVQRMRFYEDEYGLTEARLYPTAFMGWLAVVLVWFALTVLRDRREAFAFGALIAGFLLIAVLHLINPNQLIARVNIARALSGRRFDADYTGKLGADAVPTLVDALHALNRIDRCRVANGILLGHHNDDWRAWNWSRARAAEAIRSNLDDLHRAAGHGEVTAKTARAPTATPCAFVAP